MIYALNPTDGHQLTLPDHGYWANAPTDGDGQAELTWWLLHTEIVYPS